MSPNVQDLAGALAVAARECGLAGDALFDASREDDRTNERTGALRAAMYERKEAEGWFWNAAKSEDGIARWQDKAPRSLAQCTADLAAAIRAEHDAGQRAAEAAERVTRAEARADGAREVYTTILAAFEAACLEPEPTAHAAE